MNALNLLLMLSSVESERWFSRVVYVESLQILDLVSRIELFKPLFAFSLSIHNVNSVLSGNANKETVTVMCDVHSFTLH